MDKREITLDKVKQKASMLHGSKYTYVELLKEKGKPVRVVCICPTHGEFTIRAARHYTEGKGCPKCSSTTSIEEFIRRAKEKHGNRYDYSKVVFSTLKDKVTIICKEHGEFMQTANDHVLYRGCPKCGVLKRVKSKTKDTEWFINKASKLHSNKYLYDKTVYKKAAEKVTITCPEHGDFQQKPIQHTTGQGCPDCGIQKVTEVKRNSPDKNMWSYSNWKKAGEGSKHFDGYKLYIIECSDLNGEMFIKVGKTYNKVSERFRGANIPYEWKLVKVIEGSALYISKLEEELHKNLKSSGYGYRPKIQFNGASECYNCSYSEVR
jgi:predicted  nucleic acid-binding Zn-ribbon protein